ncbi:MAG TPA: hypothetical protein VFF28_00920 [Candidatus Nanoarchaeia archaeon]|nr:hypothetical protein [Candidatus Nanoarchaeia archaeon]
MPKKGMAIRELSNFIIGAFVFITLIGIGVSYGKGEAVFKVQLAKDIGLMIEQMYNTPSSMNIYETYPEDVSSFNIKVKGKTITVFSKEGDSTKAEYNFTLNPSYPELDILLKKPQRMYIGNIAGKITITDKAPDLRKLKCSNAEIEVKNILIDSGLEISGQKDKSQAANSVAYSVVSRLEGNYDIEHARNDYIDEMVGTALPFIPSKFEAKVKDTDLIIGFRANEKEDLVVSYWPDSKKSNEAESLACRIVNGFIEKGLIKEGYGVSVAMAQTDILRNDKVSILVEFGDKIVKPVDMGEVIFDAIKDS